jgi:sec-independent protein translocase protein TatB
VFGIDSTELLVIAVAALIFIGPKELPGALRTLGRWIGTVRAHARHLTGGLEQLMREAEIAEMDAKWRREAAPAATHNEGPEPSPPPVAGAKRHPE